MNENNGGPAFPNESSVAPPGYALNENRPATKGMTLRDYFAAKFMDRAQVLYHTNDGWDAQTVAQCAYMMADAMLAERKKP